MFGKKRWGVGDPVINLNYVMVIEQYTGFFSSLFTNTENHIHLYLQFTKLSIYQNENPRTSELYIFFALKGVRFKNKISFCVHVYKMVYLCIVNDWLKFWIKGEIQR